MKYKLISLLPFIGAPFLLIDFVVHAKNNGNFGGSDSTHVFDIFYLTGWITSILIFLKTGVAGNKLRGQSVLIIQLLFLSLALLSDIAAFVPPMQSLTITLDVFWPVSNVMMLISGICIIIVNELKGINRFAVFFAGCWLPLSVILPRNMVVSAYLSGIYSFAAWSFMGFVAWKCLVKVQRTKYESISITDYSYD